MQVRRVVTGADAKGRSFLASDDTDRVVVRFNHTPGSEITRLWTIDGAPPAIDGPDLTLEPWTLEPPIAGINWQIITRPPDPPPSDCPDAGDHGPGTFDRPPGAHSTDSVDLIMVLAGEISLRVDDAEVDLVAGDCVVQRGTVHSWRNRGSQPCRMMAVMISTRR